MDICIMKANICILIIDLNIYHKLKHDIDYNTYHGIDSDHRLTSHSNGST